MPGGEDDYCTVSTVCVERTMWKLSAIRKNTDESRGMEASRTRCRLSSVRVEEREADQSRLAIMLLSLHKVR